MEEAGSRLAANQARPKCKAANLIRRLMEGGVARARPSRWLRAAMPDVARGSPHQLYIINSHKYANSPWRRAEARRLRDGRVASVSHADLPASHSELPSPRSRRGRYTLRCNPARSKRRSRRFLQLLERTGDARVLITTTILR